MSDRDEGVSASMQLIPNLGGEEGRDDVSVRRSPEVRVAARLWALLYGREAEVLWPAAAASDPMTRVGERVASFWPGALAAEERASSAAYPWLEAPGAIVPWLRTPALEAEYLGRPEKERLLGPSSACVARVHDKAFALEAGRRADVLDRDLSALLTALGPEQLSPASAALDAIEAAVRKWPAEMQRRWTVKPRLGTSGRGRVPMEGLNNRARLEGALERLAARGGAMVEPWFDRVRDLSVCLHLDRDEAGGAETSAIRLLGSLEMLTTPGGGYAGHCGEIDARGRVFSGDRQDETLRADAAAMGRLAAAEGYFGPCGLDAFRYRDFQEPGRERLRSAVEFNARPTMGLAVLGLLRRLFPGVKAPLGLEPGERRAFLFAMLPPGENDLAEGLANRAALPLAPLRLSELEEPGSPQPTLFWGRDLSDLRGAYLEAVAHKRTRSEHPDEHC